MDVDKIGNFSMVIDKLSNGLRPSKRNPRNSGFLVTSSGMVGRDGVLQQIESMTRMATTAIVDGFPFPQLFVFTNMIIVCGKKTIYEWVSGSLSLKYTATTARGTWSAVDFYDYVYLSNGVEAVIRSAESKTYSKVTTQPTATAMCNYNGQVLIGAPAVTPPGTDTMLRAGELTLTVTPIGTDTFT